jgi:MarR family transcriptional regulator, lower aerobic nicotinate degradation pathway regulator
VLNELERDGFVARVRDEQDRRRNSVALTASGADALKELDQRVELAQRTLLAPLSADESSKLTRLLTRLVDHHSRT